MLVKNVTRGCSVDFSTKFYNANNELILPFNPVLTLYYKSNTVYITSNVSFNTTDNITWQASWNSSNADVGIVEWHISGGSSTPIAMDGDFRILSNKANGGPGAD